MRMATHRIRLPACRPFRQSVGCWISTAESPTCPWMKAYAAGTVPPREQECCQPMRHARQC
eukprot:2202787-Rhodomonas_salina.3